MSDYAPTISIRLPDDARARLDAATRLTRRSRSYLMKEALDRYLGDLEREQKLGPAKSGLLAFEGKGARAGRMRSPEEIDSHIRWLRDNA